MWNASGIGKEIEKREVNPIIKIYYILFVYCLLTITNKRKVLRNLFKL